MRRSLLEILLKKLIATVHLTLLLVMALAPTAAIAADLANGAKVFNANCSACHVGGSNVIISSKTLKKGALEKYDMFSLAAIQQQVANGKNAMPSFKSRLNSNQIEDVATYVLSQAEKGW